MIQAESKRLSFAKINPWQIYSKHILLSAAIECKYPLSGLMERTDVKTLIEINSEHRLIFFEAQ